MKFWSVQILRFIAAAMVVHFHATFTSYNLTGEKGFLGDTGLVIGAAGVDLFFVISGFIITRTAAQLTPGAFLLKRARRILPFYWLAALPWVVTAMAQAPFGWREALASGLLWPATDRMVAPALPVAWTLCFEMLFYGSFAIVIWRRWTIWPLLAFYAGALVMGRGALMEYLGNPLILEFLFGVGIALLPRVRAAIWALPAGVALLVLLTPYANLQGQDVDYLIGNDNWRRVLTFGVPAALVLIGTLQWEAREGLLTELGDASYAIYLFHVPLLLALTGVLHRFADLPADVMIWSAVAFATWVGWRIHVLFEKPLLARLSRRMRLEVPTKLERPSSL
jgi:exopolysaccharide production protein ExoZ